MHLSAALQYSWEKGSVNAKQCVAPISMPGFRLLGLEPRSRFTIVRDLTQSGWRATRLRRGGCPPPPAERKSPDWAFCKTTRTAPPPPPAERSSADWALCKTRRTAPARTRASGPTSVRQHRRKRFPVRQRPCPFKTQRVRAALRFFHQQNFFHSVCLRELYLDYLIHGGGDGAAHEISRDRQLAMTAVNQHA